MRMKKSSEVGIFRSFEMDTLEFTDLNTYELTSIIL